MVQDLSSRFPPLPHTLATVLALLEGLVSHLSLLDEYVFFCYSVDPNDQKKTACYDIDVEVDDTLKTQMNSFLLSTASQQEIAGLDHKVCGVELNIH